ncbi:MAG: hypothetical protein H6799_03490 [Candidatus Nomurabacteria bacterium]|nr:MAG: hypothetical protein H6799_03490 [Candidatus Nomurabacteria bacterium]
MKKIVLTLLSLLVSALVIAGSTRAESYISNITSYPSDNKVPNIIFNNFVTTSEGKIIFRTGKTEGTNNENEFNIVTFDPLNNQYKLDPIPSVGPNIQDRASLGTTAIDSDDNIWFTDTEVADVNNYTGSSTNYIHKITPTGQKFDYVLPSLQANGCDAALFGLEFMPNGELWGYGGDIDVCNSAPGGIIVRINPVNGSIINTYETDLGYIGGLYQISDTLIGYYGVPFDNNGKSFGYLNKSSGVYTSIASGGGILSKPVLAKDGNYWATTSNDSGYQFIRINSDNSFDKFEAPTTYFSNLAVGKDGEIWFYSVDIHDGYTGSIGRLNLDGSYRITEQIGKKYIMYMSYIEKTKVIWALSIDTDTLVNGGGNSTGFPTELISLELADNSQSTQTITPKIPRSGLVNQIMLAVIILICTLTAITVFTIRKMKMSKLIVK